MKKRFILVVAIVLAFTIFAGACSAASMGIGDGAPSSGGENDISSDPVGEGSEPVSRERKVIYTVTFNMETDDFTAAVALIRGQVKIVGWSDNENVTSAYAAFTLRVKTEKLDEFIDSVKSGGAISDYSKSSQDISEQYYDIQSRIESLEAELTRLRELYTTASINDVFTISAQISNVEAQIRNLNSTLNSYDSRVDYSTVYIYLNAKAEPAPTVPYGERVKSVFVGAWAALGEMFKWLGIILLAIFPFVLGIGAPLTAILLTVHFVNKSKRKKAAAQANAPDNRD
jgi:hypothetical protein